MKPQLFVLSGANGAGKTTYAREHVIPGTFIFNGDDVYADLLKRYPDYDPEKLWGGVPQQMEKDIASALDSRSHFAFETNYSTDMASEVTKVFKDAGYETNLIHFGLNSIYEAFDRVDHRVQLGGHNLSSEDIKTNFEMGLKLVKENLPLYDTIKFADTSIYGIAPIVAYFIKNTARHEILNNDIKWFNEDFKQPLLNLAINRIEEINREITKERSKDLGRDKGEDQGFERGFGIGR